MNFRKNARRFFAVIAIVFTALNSVGYAQPNVYLSFIPHGVGGAADNTSGFPDIGDSVSVYIWVDENFSIDTSACFSIVRSGAASIEITGVEVFNPDIVDQNTGQTVNLRWQAVSIGQVLDDSVEDVCGTAVGGGTGILPSQSSNKGPVVNVLVDTLHDPESNAFLFARVDFVVVACGTANLEFELGEVMDGGGPIVPSYGSVTITTYSFLGDVNEDGIPANLLDVAPFVNLIFTATYHVNGDLNMDGLVNVHDIPLFVELLQSDGDFCDL